MQSLEVLQLTVDCASYRGRSLDLFLSLENILAARFGPGFPYPLPAHFICSPAAEFSSSDRALPQFYSSLPWESNPLFWLTVSPWQLGSQRGGCSRWSFCSGVTSFWKWALGRWQKPMKWGLGLNYSRNPKRTIYLMYFHLTFGMSNFHLYQIWEIEKTRIRLGCLFMPCPCPVCKQLACMRYLSRPLCPLTSIWS